MEYAFFTLTGATIFSTFTKSTEAYFTFSPTAVVPNTTVTSLTVTHKFTAVGQYAVTLTTAKRKDGVTSGKDKTTSKQTLTVR